MTELEQQLMEQNKDLFAQNQALLEQVRQLTEKILYLNKKLFGSSSEKTRVAEGLISLFVSGPFFEDPETTEDKTVEEITYPRKKQKGWITCECDKILSNWIITTSYDWLFPIYELLRHELVQHKVLHADENALSALKSNGWEARHFLVENLVIPYD